MEGIVYGKCFFMQHHANPNDNSHLGGSYFVVIAMNVPSTLEFYNPSMC
jgi:hypothetical protein